MYSYCNRRLTVPYFLQNFHEIYIFLLMSSATSITEETCIVEMRIWCKKIGTVNFIVNSYSVSSSQDHRII